MHEIINDCADWQWNVNSWSKQDSPAAAISHFLARQHTRATEHSDRPFAWLCYGQRGDATAVAAYRACRDSIGDEGLFTAVLKAHGHRKADLEEAAVHLEWQAHNHPLSLTTGWESWQGGAGGAVEAMFQILLGQSHNGSACQLYRACFHKNLAAFFEAVGVHVAQLKVGGHDHPYLHGATPNASVLRDQVPTAVDDRTSRGGC
ncbi:hypothetical protein [Streptomyces sp. NPDC005407]|uniref:hypothetical protein n=1 Tax=Streptomyces sp. NPDC005407 TaxID=3155340 RepID=UPI0033A7758F